MKKHGERKINGEKYGYPKLMAKYRRLGWEIECSHYSKFTFSNCACAGKLKLPIRDGESVQPYNRCYLYDTKSCECHLKNVYVGIDLSKSDSATGSNWEMRKILNKEPTYELPDWKVKEVTAVIKKWKEQT